MSGEKKKSNSDEVTPKVAGTIRRDFLEKTGFLTCKLTACWMCEGSGCDDCDDAGYYIALDMAFPSTVSLRLSHPDDVG